jgi:hypothetical protein
MKTLKQLMEGGNVFKDGDGNPLTQRINQSDVPETVLWIEQLTGIDFPRERWLGSTGKSPTSGDMDMGVDTSEISKEQLAARLTQWAVSHKLKPEEWVKKGGEVHFRTPIAGRPQNGYVQTDFMFFPNLDWGTFFYSGGEDSAYKGMNRNVLMSSIAKQLGLKVGANGMFSRTTNQLLDGGMDPDYVARALLGPRATRENLKNVESIFAALAKDKDKEAKVKDFRDYLTKEGLAQPDAVKEDTDTYFLARLRDRIVNQGMQPLVETPRNLYTIYEAADGNVGGKAKGIEHLEDLVFRKGTAGIKEALAIVAAVSQDPATTTVKWDGKPAIIFGRDDNGTFILTDVAGFGAKGYNGLFTSPTALANQMAQRDATAQAKGNAATRVQELVPIYSGLWPMLEAAVPKNFRGYIHGDLLYTSQPPLVAGNYVFRPNTIPYRIPANSDVGRRIGDSEVGVAIHTYYPEPGAPKQALTQAQVDKLRKVPGLLLIEPVTAKEPVKPESAQVKSLKALLSTHGAAIDGLFNPAELRALEITDLPRLCVDYINSLVGDESVVGFDPNTLLPGFGAYLQKKVSARKYNNIVEYLQSPRSNSDGITAAFSAFILLHNIKEDLQQKLDLQHPGQEGWVFSTPAGVAKAVNRFGFSRANRAVNNPETMG